MTLDTIPTPCFVLDMARLRANLKTATKIRREAGCQILLATKAFALPAAFPIMRDYLDGTTASGEQEARLGAETFGKEVHVYSPAYAPGEVESLTQTAQHPRAAFAMSPWTDLTLSGASLQTKSEVLLPVSRMDDVIDRYLDGAPRNDPRASPLFARYENPPPVLIQVSGKEALRDDALRMRAGLGEAADIRVWQDVPHVWQMFEGYIPQARSALVELADFVQASFDSDNR